MANLREKRLESMTAPNTLEQNDCRDPSSCSANELGWASFFLGAVLFLAAPITMVLAVLIWRFADNGQKIVLLHAWLARAGVLIGLLVGIASISFGVWGLRCAKLRRQPAAIALAGLILAFAAISVWIIAVIGLLNTTESMLFIYGR
jgi:hypothetical protein